MNNGVGLIVPDVHEKIVKLQRILKMYEGAVAWVLFLGDFLDSYDGLTQYTHMTAKWLVENLGNPKYHFLFGNHDIHYAWPLDGIICSGYTRAKQLVVNNYLKREHWDHFRLMAWIGEGENEWLCSHAGIHESLLHPREGYGKDAMKEMEMKALADLPFGQIDPLLAPGRGRGGYAKYGGIDWLDWNTEFSPIEGLNQIVGHTNGKSIRWKDTAGSRNCCLDTNLNHVMLVDNGKLEIQDVRKDENRCEF